MSGGSGKRSLSRAMWRALEMRERALGADPKPTAVTFGDRLDALVEHARMTGRRDILGDATARPVDDGAGSFTVAGAMQSAIDEMFASLRAREVDAGCAIDGRDGRTFHDRLGALVDRVRAVAEQRGRGSMINAVTQAMGEFGYLVSAGPDVNPGPLVGEFAHYIRAGEQRDAAQRGEPDALASLRALVDELAAASPGGRAYGMAGVSVSEVSVHALRAALRHALDERREAQDALAGLVETGQATDAPAVELAAAVTRRFRKQGDQRVAATVRELDQAITGHGLQLDIDGSGMTIGRRVDLLVGHVRQGGDRAAQAASVDPRIRPEQAAYREDGFEVARRVRDSLAAAAAAHQVEMPKNADVAPVADTIREVMSRIAAAARRMESARADERLRSVQAATLSSLRAGMRAFDYRDPHGSDVAAERRVADFGAHVAARMRGAAPAAAPSPEAHHYRERMRGALVTLAGSTADGLLRVRADGDDMEAVTLVEHVERRHGGAIRFEDVPDAELPDALDRAVERVITRHRQAQELHTRHDRYRARLLAIHDVLRTAPQWVRDARIPGQNLADDVARVITAAVDRADRVTMAVDPAVPGFVAVRGLRDMIGTFATSADRIEFVAEREPHWTDDVLVYGASPVDTMRAVVAEWPQQDPQQAIAAARRVLTRLQAAVGNRGGEAVVGTALQDHHAIGRQPRHSVLVRRSGDGRVAEVAVAVRDAVPAVTLTRLDDNLRWMLSDGSHRETLSSRGMHDRIRPGADAWHLGFSPREWAGRR